MCTSDTTGVDGASADAASASTDADATRRFFRDTLQWPSLDAGGGWLIFKAPPGELGVHPTSAVATDAWGQVPYHQASLLCDDLTATVAELRGRGTAR